MGHPVLTPDYVRQAVLGTLAADVYKLGHSIAADLMTGDEDAALVGAIRLDELAGALQDTLGVSTPARAIPATSSTPPSRPGLRLLPGGLDDGA